MAIREEKKKLLFRDDVLMVIAFAASGWLHWQAGKHEDSDIVLVFSSLSYVLGTIGILILYGIIATRKSRREEEKRRKELR